jgi:molybdopterin-containing oxidoreductase family membrane subunit
MSEVVKDLESKIILNKVVQDITSPFKKHYGIKPWLIAWITIASVGAFAYFLQLRDGLGVTAMNDYVSWGLYISNFVFWVATSLVGMLISAVMGLLKVKWITPIARIAEIIAFAFVMWAGLVIVFDMGRPDRLQNVFLHGRLQSPIVWDLTVVLTYTVISALLLFLPMIPDMAILKNKLTDAPKWQKKMFNILSLGWIGTPEQYKTLHRAIRILLITVIPVAMAIHTVTAWLFASTLRPGWDSTIFGPYFVAGAFPAGVAAVIIAMFIFMKFFNLKEYLTEKHFNLMGKLLVLVSLVYLYFNLNEYLVPGYKMKTAEGAHLEELFTGHFAPLFWSVQILGLILPIIVLLFKKGRQPLPLFITALFVIVGAYFKRYLIVVPTMLHPYLPIQGVPEHWTHYFPNGFEMLVTGLAFSGTILTITLISKIFPIIPIAETVEEQGVSQEQLATEILNK